MNQESSILLDIVDRTAYAKGLLDVTLIYYPDDPSLAKISSELGELIDKAKTVLKANI